MKLDGTHAIKSWKSQSASTLTSPAHSWHSPKIRPRTHCCSRAAQAPPLDAQPRRPQSAIAKHSERDARDEVSETATQRSDRLWKTGEMAKSCSKICSRAQRMSRGTCDFAEFLKGHVKIEEPHERSWSQMPHTAGRYTMEIDQPTLSHYLSYSRFQGNPYFYPGGRYEAHKATQNSAHPLDPRFTHDVFNASPALTRLADLRRMPRSKHSQIRT